MQRWIALATLAAGMPASAFAQSASPQTAPSPWSLHDALEAPDRLKLSATVRVRLDAIEGQPRPGLNASDLTVNLRTTLFAEYDIGPLRIGGEVYDSRIFLADRGTPISTNEVNAFEPVQAYVALDLDKPLGLDGSATVQAGRFVLNLGARRLVAADDFRNTTNGYTGIRASVTTQRLRATAFYVLPQRRGPEDFAALEGARFALDREGSDLVLWGGVATRLRAVGPVAIEGTYMRLDERDTPRRATRDRRLVTYGFRVFREPAAGKVDFEVEAFLQRGTISTGVATSAARPPVHANFVHADVGYSFVHPWRPRVSLRFDRASGDRGYGVWRRFDTLFGMRRAELAPSGLYNSVGRANLASPAVRLELAPGRRTDLFVEYRPLWLASRTDAFSTTGVRDLTGRSGSFAGHQLEARWRQWLVIDALRFEANALFLAKGRFLRDAPNSARTGDTAYGSLNLTGFF